MHSIVSVRYSIGSRAIRFPKLPVDGAALIAREVIHKQIVPALAAANRSGGGPMLVGGPGVQERSFGLAGPGRDAIRHSSTKARFPAP